MLGFIRFTATLASPRAAWLGVLLVLALGAPLPAQTLKLQLGAGAKGSGSNAPVQLPSTAEEIARRLKQIEVYQAEAASRAVAPTPEATPEEANEYKNLVKQWSLALEMQSRALQRLEPIRRVNATRAAEARDWKGFEEKPPYSLNLVEQLRDTIAAHKLEAETDRVMISIAENSVTREAVRLSEALRQRRLVEDQPDTGGASDQRRQWLGRLAEQRVATYESGVERLEMGRLVGLEKLAGQRQYIDFLEEQLAVARTQTRFTAEDLTNVVARVNQTRERLRAELAEAMALDGRVREKLRVSQERLRQTNAPPAADELAGLRAWNTALLAQNETSEVRLELLRSLLNLCDYTETLWKDRFWLSTRPSLAEIRAKQRSHQAIIEAMRPWRKYAESKTSATSAQLMAEAVRSSAPNLGGAEREAVKAAEATLEERMRLYQRAINALALIEGVYDRMESDMAEREANESVGGRAQTALTQVEELSRRIWNTELYVAEDTVIADGQRISVARPITIGKTLTALGIFLGGVLLARWGHGSVKRASARWFKGRERTSGAVAKLLMGVVVVGALCVAMTSVRIPWTVFAFLGGALAIGVGFGAQTLINNFISGVILLFERSIRVGDIVEVGDQRGKVESVGFRNSLVKRTDGIDVLVPNSKFLDSAVVNWTLTDDLVRYKLTVGVAYGSPLKRVSALIAQAAEEHSHVVKEPKAVVLLEDFGDNALVFSLVFWMKLAVGVDGAVVRSDLRHRIHELFEQEKIVMAYPQRDVHLDTVRPLQVRVLPPDAPPGA